MSNKMLVEDNETGSKFMVRVVHKGDKYGRNLCKTHRDHEPMVEFYDAFHAHTKDVDGTVLGLFINRYLVSTIATDGEGLILQGGVPEWNLSSRTMDAVRAFIAPLIPLQYEHDFTF